MQRLKWGEVARIATNFLKAHPNMKPKQMMKELETMGVMISYTYLANLKYRLRHNIGSDSKGRKSTVEPFAMKDVSKLRTQIKVRVRGYLHLLKTEYQRLEKILKTM